MGGLCTFPRGVDSRCDALLVHLTASPLSHPNGPNWLRAGNSPEDGWAVQLFYGGWTLTRCSSRERSPCSPHRKSIIPPEWPELASSREFDRRWVGCATSPWGWTPAVTLFLAHLTASPLSHPNGPNWLRAGNSPEDGWAVQGLHGGWTPVVTLFLLTSPQVHYPTRMVRIGFEQEIRPKIGGLCNFSTGVDFRCDAPISHLSASPLSHPNGPNWLRAGNSPEDGWALQLLYGGWTPGDALLAHLTASPLSHSNGPNWLRAGNSPEDGWAVQLFHGGWTPAVTLSLLTSPQVHYPTRMARIGFEQGIRPKMGGLCNFSTGGGLSLLRSPCSPHRKSIIPQGG